MQISIKQSWLVLMAILFIAYPVSAMAANQVEQIYGAPFLPSWYGIILFSFGGGLVASFFHIDEIDRQLRHPVIAKIVIGFLSGIALCTLLVQDVSNPKPALTFWAFAASGVSAPIVAGALVYLSDKGRLFGWFDLASDFIPRPQRAKKGKDDDNTNTR